MKLERCELCRFWDAQSKKLGVCRRYPPTMVQGKVDGVRPVTKNTSSCGEWTARVQIKINGSENQT